MEVQINKIVILLMILSIIFCQPGKPAGPGGQYGNRMEMMMVWKMTEYLNLSEQQAEKLFPRMRKQRVKMRDYFDTEKELFDMHLAKIKTGEKISQSDVNAIYKKMENLSVEMNEARMKFFKSTADILDPGQQIMFLSFEPYMKGQVQKGMKERYRKKVDSGMKKGKRRR
jgi:Spy/CpxP family protein refolding chaperone